MEKRSVGDTPLNSLHDGCDSETGITYRQWLIGQALNGICANRDQWSDKSRYLHWYAIAIADKVIQRLDDEQDEENNGEAE